MSAAETGTLENVESRVQVLEYLVADLLQLNVELRNGWGQLRVDHEGLCESLCRSGHLTPEQIRRGVRACRRQERLLDVVRSPALARLTGDFGGFRAARDMAMTSRGLAGCMKAASQLSPDETPAPSVVVASIRAAVTNPSSRSGTPLRGSTPQRGNRDLHSYGEQRPPRSGGSSGGRGVSEGGSTRLWERIDGNDGRGGTNLAGTLQMQSGGAEPPNSAVVVSSVCWNAAPSVVERAGAPVAEVEVVRLETQDGVSKETNGYGTDLKLIPTSAVYATSVTLLTSQKEDSNLAALAAADCRSAARAAVEVAKADLAAAALDDRRGGAATRERAVLERRAAWDAAEVAKADLAAAEGLQAESNSLNATRIVEITSSAENVREATAVASVVVADLVATAKTKATSRPTSKESGELLKDIRDVETGVGLPQLQQPQPYVYVIGGRNSSSFDTGIMERYSTLIGAWETLPPMLTARSQCAAATIGGQLYVVGGCRTGRPLTTCERYDPAKGAWESLPRMVTVRNACSAVGVADQYLYAANQKVSRLQCPATCERFDTKGEKWQVLPLTSSPYANSMLAAVGDRLFIVLERGGNYVVERLDMNTGRWDVVPSKASAGSSYEFWAAVGEAGRLFVVGRASGSFSCEAYNPSTGGWETLRAPLSPTAVPCKVAAVLGKLYASNDEWSEEDASSTGSYRFDLASRSFEPWAAMPTPRIECAMAVAWH